MHGKGGQGEGSVMWRAATQGQREGEDTRKCKHKGERRDARVWKERPVKRRDDEKSIAKTIEKGTGQDRMTREYVLYMKGGWD